MPTVQAEQGYLIPAVNTNDVNYVACARALARSIRHHTPDAKIALLSDRRYSDLREFDYSVELPYGHNADNPYANDWQVFEASPFRETIKLEADMMIPRSIDHWWTMLRHRDVVLPIGAYNFYGNLTDQRYYRRIFDENALPDVYNAITYWRLSRTAQEFFIMVKYLFQHWAEIQPQLRYGLTDSGSTDFVYAIAAKLLGVENFTLPDASYPRFVHMRGKINHLVQEDWRRELTWELDDGNLRLNTIAQMYPVHYIQKDFAQKLNEYYDRESA